VAAGRSSAAAVTDQEAAPAACREAVVVGGLGRAYKGNDEKGLLSHKQQAGIAPRRRTLNDSARRVGLQLNAVAAGWKD